MDRFDAADIADTDTKPVGLSRRPSARPNLASPLERVSQGAAWLVLCVALVLTAVMWAWSAHQARDAFEDGMRESASSIALKLQARMSSYSVVLRAAAGLFASDRAPDRKQWSRFVAQLDLVDTLPGIHGLGYAERIHPGGRAAHEAAVRAEGFPRYSIVPEGDRPWMSSIIYLEPFEGSNLRAFGFDMLSHPVRREAMMAAAAGGVPILSGPVRLLQQADQRDEKGVLLYYPVYRKDLPVRTASERLEAVQGWVYAALVVPSYLRQATDTEPSALGLSIYDIAQDNTVETVFGTRPIAGGPAGTQRRDLPLFVAGRDWLLQFDSAAFSAERARLGTTPLLVLGFGLIASLLLFTLVWSMATTRDRALAIARDMTRQLTEVNNALESRVAARTAMLQQAKERLERQIGKRRAAERARRAALSHERELNARLQTISELAPEMTAPEPIDDKLYTLSAAARELLDGVAARARYASADDGVVHESGDGRDEWWSANPTQGDVCRAESAIHDGDGVQRGRIAVLRRRDRPFGREDQLVLDHFALLAGASLSVRESFESQLMARRQAEQSSTIKDQLLSVVSHELRTPLSAMKGWVHVLAQGRRDTDAEQGRKLALEALARSVDAQREMIEDLIDTASVLAGRFDLDIASCDPGELIRRSCDRFRALAAEKRVELSLDDGLDIGRIDADALRLRQVLDHLLENALKFTPAGGAIHVGAQDLGERIRIEVLDNGEGIEPDAMPFLFERFWMADPSTTRRVGGLGVGLSLVRAIVEAHGGIVSAQSAGRDQGARLWLELPRRRPNEHVA